MVGLVMLFSVAFLLYARNSLQPPTPTADIEEDYTLAKSCLAASVRTATAGLQNDSIITVEESGDIENSDPIPYFYIGADKTFDASEDYYQNLSLGLRLYYPLCDADGPNAIDRESEFKYLCDRAVYNTFTSQPSIQEMLQVSVSNLMQECMETTGDVQIIFQPDAILARWTKNQSVTHNENIPLETAWRAIEEMTRREVSEPLYRPGTVDCCQSASFIEVDPQLKGEPTLLDPTQDIVWDVWDVNVGDEFVARLHLENRDIVYYDQNGYIDKESTPGADRFWPMGAIKLYYESLGLPDDNIAYFPSVPGTFQAITICDQPANVFDVCEDRSIYSPDEDPLVATIVGYYDSSGALQNDLSAFNTPASFTQPSRPREQFEGWVNLNGHGDVTEGPQVWMEGQRDSSGNPVSVEDRKALPGPANPVLYISEGCDAYDRLVVEIADIYGIDSHRIIIRTGEAEARYYYHYDDDDDGDPNDIEDDDLNSGTDPLQIGVVSC